MKCKYYKMNTRRQRWHRAIYDYLVRKGVPYNEAYETASRITNWT